LPEGGYGTNAAGGFEAIHDGHLDVHENGIETSLLQRFQCQLTVLCQGYLNANLIQKLGGDLLIKTACLRPEESVDRAGGTIAIQLSRI
jgi:hypothetical protein